MNENESKPGVPSPDASHSATDAAATNTYAGSPDDLHDLFGSEPGPGDTEDPLAALRSDPNYSALIRDLEYIASQARLLFAPAESAPSDEVWSKIQSKLGQEPRDP